MAKSVVTPPQTAHDKPVTPASTVFEIDTTATEAAWKAREAQFMGVSAADVNPATLDVTRAASIAIAAAKNVLSRTEHLTATYKNFPLERIRGVIEIALAVQHGDLLHRVALDKTSLFADIFPRMIELRGLILDDLEIQVKRGKCPAKFVSDLRLGDRDAADYANDLNDGASWYATKLAEGLRSTITVEEVAEARRLAATALGRIASDIVADATGAKAKSTSERRARAFTVLLREYEQVRLYGSNAFWFEPGGWEQFVPSLWSGRSDGPVAVKAPPAPPTPPTPPTPPVG